MKIITCDTLVYLQLQQETSSLRPEILECGIYSLAIVYFSID